MPKRIFVGEEKDSTQGQQRPMMCLATVLEPLSPSAKVPGQIDLDLIPTV